MKDQTKQWSDPTSRHCLNNQSFFSPLPLCQGTRLLSKIYYTSESHSVAVADTLLGILV